MQVLEFYGMRPDPLSRWDFLGLTTVFLVFFAVATYLLMSFKNYQKR
jgi:hypothetical protein